MNLDGSDPQNVSCYYPNVSGLAMPAPIPGNIDNYNYANIDDYSIFANCMTSPDIPTPPDRKPTGRQSENNIDLAAFYLLQMALTRY